MFLMSIVGTDNAGKQLIKKLKDQMSIFAIDKISNYNTVLIIPLLE